MNKEEIISMAREAGYSGIAGTTVFYESTNDITGDALRTRPATDAYRDNFDAIFRKPDPVEGWPMLDESDWPENEERIDQIGQNGGDGAHYAAVKP